jgi:hypothetical protein
MIDKTSDASTPTSTETPLPTEQELDVNKSQEQPSSAATTGSDFINSRKHQQIMAYFSGQTTLMHDDDFIPRAVVMYNKTNSEGIVSFTVSNKIDGSAELIGEVENSTDIEELKYLCQIFIVEKEYMLDQFFNMHKRVRKFCEHLGQYVSVKNLESSSVHHYTDEHFLTDWARDTLKIERASKQKKFSKKEEDDPNAETNQET